MRIIDLLDVNCIKLGAAPKSKNEALDQIVDVMVKSGKVDDAAAFRKQVYLREEEGTTGIGGGIAIPHGKCPAVKKAGLAAMVIDDGVDFDSLDGQPVHIAFLIAAPDTSDNAHLDVLSKLSMMLMDEDFVKRLINSKSPQEFLGHIDKADSEKPDIAKSASEGNAKYRVLAVTSCPTGIAHTYMAAEGLQKAAEKIGCTIKVETRGSSGAKNVLTESEIQEAECIIVAADAKVPMERFKGKKLIECHVADGISKADKLLERALGGNVPVFNIEGGSQADTEISSDSMGHKVYTQLMNGVSHMLPFVVGGGILIAIAFLLDGISVDVASLSPEMRANFGSITPVAAMFKSIGGTAFSFMLPVLAGFIAMSIGDRPGLAVGFVGGAIAASGKSGFLGALAAGFIAGYIIILLRKCFANMPKSVEQLAPVLMYPLLGVFAIGLIMMYAIEPTVGAINMALNGALANMGGTSKVLLGIVLGGMMAIDMGGPFNKAAYIFGTASIAAGNYYIMAAVMIGGMIPPCAIALACVMFKNKFTKEQRESSPANFIMGLAFITEGAIPFAAADPLRVLPACIISSALAGALSMAFGCGLMAPHGGIFVFPVVENALFYFLSFIIGTVVGAVLLGILKKDVRESM